MRPNRDEKPVEKCGVSDCDEDGERSLSRKKVKEEMGWTLDGEDKRVHLCKSHYREFKKATKEERKIESLRR
ncbi:MAG: hypothetical protein KKH41_09680 [Candidatus Thermoplasmatota archaeon]|nr:hypothetical protein [Euryarchaeota archaeon]MBU4032806.1 hypothetical protein [Candidatus Thermoplasmatota archaeon]MBU4071601.1 hypothetical protein [Candidatus Thermoplasmatota archaeon]MBU4144361.1 hypothetical protein [Candidatus Thermoplasmatota archaeon]MBU4592833.1 hypothetical protein [Candidatus Thermoplasmatota archaeon]